MQQTFITYNHCCPTVLKMTFTLSVTQCILVFEILKHCCWAYFHIRLHRFSRKILAKNMAIFIIKIGVCHYVLWFWLIRINSSRDISNNAPNILFLGVNRLGPRHKVTTWNNALTKVFFNKLIISLAAWHVRHLVGTKGRPPQHPLI